MMTSWYRFGAGQDGSAFGHDMGVARLQPLFLLQYDDAGSVSEKCGTGILPAETDRKDAVPAAGFRTNSKTAACPGGKRVMRKLAQPRYGGGAGKLLKVSGSDHPLEQK